MSRTRIGEAIVDPNHPFWVNAPRYGEEVPVEGELRFILRKTPSDLLHIAIRGYNEGEELKAVAVGGRPSIYAEVDGRYYAATDDHFQQLLPVTKAQYNNYRDAVTQPRQGEELLVDILEQEKNGAWEVWSPGATDDFPYDKIELEDDMNGTIAYRRWSKKRKEWEYSKDHPFTIFQDGPEYVFQPRKPRPIKPLKVSSLLDRTIESPSYVRPLDS